MDSSSVSGHIIPRSIGGLLLGALSLPVIYLTLLGIYNLFFHPLCRFPGPKLAALSPLPRIHASFKGDGVHWVVALHARYGEVVRIAPNELSFASAGAFKDVYAHRGAGRPALAKDPKFYQTPGALNEAQDLVSADSDAHARQRRIFANAFSDRALKLQEPLFMTYVNKMCGRLSEEIRKDPAHKFDMVNYLNFCTFDVMADLTFGESLNMLDNVGYHPWVAAMFSSFKFGVYLHAMRYFGNLEVMMQYIVPKKVIDEHLTHREFSRLRIDRRLEKENPRADIWGLVLEKDGDGGMSRKEMYANSNLFMIAGTETTATLLSGLLYYLLAHPDKLAKLTEEIRDAFPSQEDVTIEKLQALKYLRACIEEGLRMYPPVSNGLPRIVPPEGVNVDGHDVPAGARVMVTHLATYRNPVNFREPYSFIPERWLPEHTEFAADKRHALQPFSTGPRMCLGKNMAYHEMRIILSMLLWNFDLRLCPESGDWSDQKHFIMWNKKPLMCQLTDARR